MMSHQLVAPTQMRRSVNKRYFTTGISLYRLSSSRCNKPVTVVPLTNRQFLLDEKERAVSGDASMAMRAEVLKD